MKNLLHKGPGAIARLLVRYRVVLFSSVLVMAVVCAFMIPHTNINTDMTKYLPDSYPMRQGMNILEEDLPDMHAQLREFGSVFADGNDLIPKDLPRALVTGFSLAFIVLLILCSSVMEVLLFLITIGIAVVLNMGTNALLPSVSMITHMLSSILQMVLSMDYCIILMNRFRQEKATGLVPVKAMENAVSGASGSILSSAFTTIVSLLMLMFMKIKIGADMGMVLAKGVTISLICNFTVMPCLIVWLDKAIEKTRKKPPKLSGVRSGLAVFERRFRYPLAVLFLAAFGLFFYLQGKTPMSFSPNWDSTATEQVDKNDLLLLYADADSARIPPLLDSLKAADPKVTTVVSYPSLVQRQLTAAGMAAFLKDMAGEEDVPLDGELLSLVYYARSHPERDERFRLEELLATVEEIRGKGLLDREVDIESLLAAEAPAPVAELVPENDQNPGRTGENDGLIQENDQNPGRTGENVTSQGDTLAHEVAAPARFTYAQATTPVTSDELAALAGIDPSQTARLYRLAGKTGKTMLPLELVEFVQKKVLGNRLYASFIPKDAAEQLAQVKEDLLAAIEAGPELAPIPENDQNRGRNGEDGGDGAENVPVVDIEPEPPTPLERLMDMMVSRHKYSSTRVYRALSAAGIPVTRDELDLLFLYAGAKSGADPEMTMSPGELLDFVADTLLVNPAMAPMVGDSVRTMVVSARDSLLSSVRILRGEGYSAAVIMSEYDVESAESFAYIDRTRATADAALEAPHYWIGGAEMYKELKEGFPAEVTLLTILTVLSIFLIVAFTFRSILIPIPLVLTVLTGIYAEVWAVGATGQTMYFLSYLIVQGILMGATIDYTILFTGYYLRSRKTMSRDMSLEAAYDGSMHSILTSGLILTIVPFAMSFAMSDAMICSILKSISAGGATILMLVLLVLPGVIAALDRVVVPKRRRAD